MTVLSAQTIRQLAILDPHVERTVHEQTGTSFGLSYCGYDIRLAEHLTLRPGVFSLGSTVEKFTMPPDVVGVVHDKSTWARRGIAVQNTVIEPGWRGFLTLELTNHSTEDVELPPGTPIAQVLFHRLDHVPERTYSGKYQDQAAGPQPAISEVL
jgi:dCTP deaminase